jgi:hypothetical protein
MWPMKDAVREGLLRSVRILLAWAFAIVSVTSAICPVCLSQELARPQQASLHNSDQHRATPDCDKDGCSCCGFQFLTVVHQSNPQAHESAEALAPLPTLELSGYAPDFYHPPRT